MSGTFGRSLCAEFHKHNGLLLVRNFSVSCASSAMRAYFSLSPLCHLCVILSALLSLLPRWKLQNSGGGNRDSHLRCGFLSLLSIWVKCVARRWQYSNRGPVFALREYLELSRDLCDSNVVWMGKDWGGETSHGAGNHLRIAVFVHSIFLKQSFKF